MLKFTTTCALVLALGASALSCLCWVQLVSESCHVSQAMSNCCCGDEPEVTRAEQELPPALPSSSVALSPLTAAEDALESPPRSVPKTSRVSDRTESRASPHLYLLNTSFLI